MWAWAVTNIVVIVFLVGQADQKYPAVILGAFAFAFVQWWLPACRPISHNWLCPWNWALAVFFLQLVATPVLITLGGPVLGVLPYLPSPFAINMAILVNTIAFLSFSCTYSHFAGRRKDRTDLVLEHATTEFSVQRSPALWSIGIYLSLGILGIILTFGTLSGLLGYFTNPAETRDLLLEPGTWSGLFGMLLRPFLGFAFAMIWCRRMDHIGCGRGRLSFAVFTALILAAVILGYGTFGYNRGSFTVPLVAMAAVSSAKRERFSLAVMTIGIILVLLMAPALEAYRSGDFSGQEVFEDPSARDALVQEGDVTGSIQIYGAAPQFLAFLLENNGWTAAPHWGEVTVSSFLSPFPILGKPFRESSGTTIYNTMIYDTPEIHDQIVPFQGELFLDFNIVGVILGYCFLGWIAHKLQTAFERSRSGLDLFIWQYAAIWTFFLIFGSISVVSQIYFCFGWPIYLYFLYRRLTLCSARNYRTFPMRESWFNREFDATNFSPK
jgi:oligosaccharide repeat unit polymerase